MAPQIKAFLASDTGAVTVDWVVLTAAIVGLGMAVLSVIAGGVENISADVAQALANELPNSAGTFAGMNAVTITGVGDIAGP